MTTALLLCPFSMDETISLHFCFAVPCRNTVTVYFSRQKLLHFGNAAFWLSAGESSETSHTTIGLTLAGVGSVPSQLLVNVSSFPRALTSRRLIFVGDFQPLFYRLLITQTRQHERLRESRIDKHQACVACPSKTISASYLYDMQHKWE